MKMSLQKKTYVLKNEDEVKDQLYDFIMGDELALYRYQIDLYLYIDENGIGRITDFQNPGGNSWLDDEHWVVCKIGNHTERPIDTFQTIDEIADAIGKSEQALKQEVAEKYLGEDYTADDVDYSDVYSYVLENYEDAISDAYEEYLGGDPESYVWDWMESQWRGFLEDHPEIIVE